MAITCDTRVKEGEKCRAEVGNEREITGTIKFLKDKKRSFGKPESTMSRSVMKKTCDIGRHHTSRTPRDCADVQAEGATISGIYLIHPLGVDNPFHVYCDMETEGGGWTMFQRRLNPLNRPNPVTFDRNTTSYKEGFGSVAGDHWLGNEKLHRLTLQGTYKLRVDITLIHTEEPVYAEYGQFSIGNDSSKYSLKISNHSGSADDEMSFLSGLPFFNPTWTVYCRGGWWRDFHSCTPAYFPNGVPSDWLEAPNYFGWAHNLIAHSSEMKIRPA
ncbi:angiopoietin-4-like [Lytechinus variegatus]|uniref:angiopoietin-4-like n=1 Tax=Lytechinus variegatus TaxID=7654 RepID=UPI001BB29796|nr:angiopoietin-4-like [Lytechinus variegatus]